MWLMDYLEASYGPFLKSLFKFFFVLFSELYSNDITSLTAGQFNSLPQLQEVFVFIFAYYLCSFIILKNPWISLFVHFTPGPHYKRHSLFFFVIYPFCLGSYGMLSCSQFSLYLERVVFVNVFSCFLNTVCLFSSKRLIRIFQNRIYLWFVSISSVFTFFNKSNNPLLKSRTAYFKR